MKRPGVLERYQRAGRLERILSGHRIPIVPALEFNGSGLQCRDGQYFHIFQWTDAKALDRHEIKEGHCRIIGRLLARIISFLLKMYVQPHPVLWPDNSAQIGSDTSVWPKFCIQTLPGNWPGTGNCFIRRSRNTMQPLTAYRS